jgi:hypothetical protein
MHKRIPGKDDGIIFRNIFIPASVFVHTTSRMVVIRYHRERPSRQDVFARDLLREKGTATDGRAYLIDS